MSTRVLPSPLGPIRLVVDGGGLRAIDFCDVDTPLDRADDDEVLDAAEQQLTAFFAGDRRSFELPLAPAGTAFQRRVWEELRRIPFGETRSYAQIATAIGRPSATRAVGAANGRNPLAIVVPCHRVIGADGSLTGYAGGLDRKRKLLALERGARVGHDV